MGSNVLQQTAMVLILFTTPLKWTLFDFRLVIFYHVLDLIKVIRLRDNNLGLRLIVRPNREVASFGYCKLLQVYVFHLLLFDLLNSLFRHFPIDKGLFRYLEWSIVLEGLRFILKATELFIPWLGKLTSVHI